MGKIPNSPNLKAKSNTPKTKKKKTKHISRKKKDGNVAKQRETNADIVREKETVKIYKSPRFKGYLTIALASVINYHAAEISMDPINLRTIPANKTQQEYAIAVSLVSAVIAGILVLIHIDRLFFTSFWIKAFGNPKSYLELGIIIFLVLWWSIATIIQTGVLGIAGDGRGQLNLYYSTWVCLYTSIWVLERKIMDFDFPSIRGFITGWPYRAPGWIAILLSSFFTLCWYIDLYLNTYSRPDRLPENLRILWDDVEKSQYLWLLFIASITMLPSGIFMFLEIIRTNPSSDDAKGKGSLETIAEGFCLALLTLCWIPSVIIVTTPGGFASKVGNAYFFTWLTTIMVLETMLWFIHDARGNVQKSIMEKEIEYQKHKEKVLNESKARHRNDAVTTIDSLTDIRAALEMIEDPDEDIEGDEELHGNDDNDQGSLIHSPSRMQYSKEDNAKEEVEFEEYEMAYNDADESVREEQRLKSLNKKAYFNSLDDILE